MSDQVVTSVAALGKGVGNQSNGWCHIEEIGLNPSTRGSTVKIQAELKLHDLQRQNSNLDPLSTTN